MGSRLRYVPEFVALLAIVLIQWQLARWLLAHPRVQKSRSRRLAVQAGTAVICLSFVASSAFEAPVLAKLLPYSWWLDWIRGTALAWAVCSTGVFLVALLWRQAPQFDPSRRKLLGAVRAATFAAPVALTGFSIFVERLRLRLREIDIPIQGLPKDLHGLRIVQLSDIHLSPFLSERDLERAIEMANDTRAQVALVTGDLITMRSDPLNTCLQLLTKLRAEAGILGCLGNHEIVAQCEAYTRRQGQRLGMHFLRKESRQLRFGDAMVNFVGVDYQPMSWPYLRGIAKLVRPDHVNILLSHNPDVFPVAARQGFDLTIAGHTHGGQITIEILHQYVNVARFFTPYIYGLYQMGRSSIYVTRGIGTVGIPARAGAPAEIALIRLCAT